MGLAEDIERVRAEDIKRAWAVLGPDLEGLLREALTYSLPRALERGQLAPFVMALQNGEVKVRTFMLSDDGEAQKAARESLKSPELTGVRYAVLGHLTSRRVSLGLRIYNISLLACSRDAPHSYPFVQILERRWWFRRRPLGDLDPGAEHMQLFPRP